MALKVSDRARPHGGLVRALTLARPEKRNALDAEHLGLLEDALRAAEADERVRAIVLRAEGKAFCAGYDLSRAFDPEGPDSQVIRTMAALRAVSKPTVALVEGAAFGAGLELAISCDLRVASESASFCLPPAKLGIAYAPEGLARLAALVGTAAARRICFTGRVFSALEAKELGLVDELVDSDQEPTDEMLAEGYESGGAASRADELADAMADVAPRAVAVMKRTLNALEPVLSPEQRREWERERIALFASEDAAEGLAAFAARRAPVFRGR